MGACKVEPDASQQFAILRDYWKRKNYRSIVSDLDEAFKTLSRDVYGCHFRLAERTSAILIEAAPERDLALHKYRHKDKASSEGARGGWRIWAIFDRATETLYPIIVYPHKEWSDAPDELIKKCVSEIVTILEQRDLDSN